MIEVNTPQTKKHWEDVLLGSFDEWVKAKIAPTLQANEEKRLKHYETNRRTN